MTIYPIHTGNFKLDGGAMFGVVPKGLWERTNPADEKNLCTWAMRSLLIENGERLILIDTGIGEKQHEKFLVIITSMATTAWTLRWLRLVLIVVTLLMFSYPLTFRPCRRRSTLEQRKNRV